MVVKYLTLAFSIHLTLKMPKLCYKISVEGIYGAFYFAIKRPSVCVKHRFPRQEPAKAQAGGLLSRIR
jgi:hypothetical protein